MIYVITGVMASGKSTVAELLAKEFSKSVHLHGDIFRKMIVCGREEMSDAPSREAFAQLDMRYRITAEAAKEYHKSGFTVIVQDNYYGEMLPRFLTLLEPEPVEALHRDFAATTPHIGLWIDNSHQTPEETMRKILKGAE